jgi:hypothetical protein
MISAGSPNESPVSARFVAGVRAADCRRTRSAAGSRFAGSRRDFAPEDAMKKLAPLTFVAICVVLSIAASNKDKDTAKTSLSLRATPAMAFAPARITLTAQLKGEVGDKEDFYCPTVEWEWGDGTISQSSGDCEPFQPNKSDIQKSFMTQHVYKTGGEYEVKIRLKKAERVVAMGTASLNISRAIDEMGDIIR